MTKQVPRHESICVAAGEGPGGFQVTGMIECGKKSKPRKFPRASNKTQDNHWTKKTFEIECLCLFLHHTI